MFFGALNIDVALQISNKILFEEPFGDALTTSFNSLWYEVRDEAMKVGRRR